MKTDARVRYTRMRIREAFLSCLEKKPISKITVKEICDLAEINRATFYKHYADPFELMEKLEEESLENLRQIIEKRSLRMQGGMLLAICQNIKNTGNSYTILASENGDPAFAARISELFYDEFQPQIAQNLPDCTEEEKNSAYLFLAGGCGNLIAAWIKNGMDGTPEQAAKKLGQLSDCFVKAWAEASIKSGK